MKRIEVLRKKRVLAFSCFLLSVSLFVSSAFSQENLQDATENEHSETLQGVTENEQETVSLQTDSEVETSVKVDLSPFLLRSGFRAKTYYHQPDGTPVKYKQMREMVSVAPGNEILLKQERRWRGATKILACVFLATVATDVAAAFVDNDSYRSRINQINIPIQTISFLYSIATAHISNVKLQQSVDNYNYYIAKQPER